MSVASILINIAIALLPVTGWLLLFYIPVVTTCMLGATWAIALAFWLCGHA